MGFPLCALPNGSSYFTRVTLVKLCLVGVRCQRQYFGVVLEWISSRDGGSFTTRRNVLYVAVYGDGDSRPMACELDLAHGVI